MQRQGQLLPAFVDDALDPSDGVFFVDDVVDGIDLTTLEQRYAVGGGHAYDPRLLLKLGLYGATQGERPFAEIQQAMRRRLDAARVPRVPRQLSWPRHVGRACHERDTLASYPEPRRSLGSAS